MSLIRAVVERPIATLMGCLVVLLLGSVALSRLAIDLLPDVSYPTISVVTVYEGAGPEQIETLITRPMEQALSSVQGVERLSSESMEGSNQVRVQFAWGTDLDAAMGEVSSRVERLKRNLPDGVQPPFLRRYDVASSPIVYLGLSGSLDPAALTRLAENVVIPRLERVDGVAAAQLRGGYIREIEVNLDRDKLAALNMGVAEVTSSLQLANQSRPAGNFRRGDRNLLIRGGGEFQSLDDIENTVVRESGEAFVRVRDVATVVDGEADLTELTRVDGEPALMVYVNKRSGANTVAVSDALHEAIGELNSNLRGARLSVRIDKADFIRQSIDNMTSAALIGAALAVLVLVVFLHDVRSTLVVSAVMPLAILATFLLMYLKGFTLNIVSFGGLALSMGMLVDNSIVILESIFRQRELGLDRKEAAIRGTAEVAGAVIAGTLTTVIVFIPLIFIEGVTGVLLHQLAWVVTFSQICSLLVGLSITPVLAAWWLGESNRKLRSGLFAPMHRLNHRLISGWEAAYATLLRQILRHGGLTAFLLLFVFTIGVSLWPRIGTEFLPQTDDGELRVYLKMEPGIHLDRLDEQSRAIERTIAEHVPEATSTAAFVGGDADDGDEWNEAWFATTLSPRTERTRSRDEIRKALAESIGPTPGATVRVTAAEDQAFGRLFRGGDGGAIVVEIRGHELETGDRLADDVADLMRGIDGFVNIEIGREDRRPEMAARIDRIKVGAAGLRVSDIAQTLEATVRGIEATVYRDGGDEVPIRVRLRPEDRSRFADVQQVGLTMPDGRIVPLKNFVSFAPEQAPVTIRRLDRQRVVEVSADVEGSDLGTAVGRLQARLDTLPLPEGFSINLAGDWEEQQKSFAALTLGFAMSLVLVYMVMAAQFESLRDPLVILIAIPFGLVGVILALVTTATTLNVQSFIGLVILVGIVVNNAIVLVDYYKLLKTEEPDLAADELAVRGALRRFRPIIMTTATSILGTLPIALGWGEGGELQAPLARVVVGGLLTGTVVTLVAIPLITYWRVAKPAPRPVRGTVPSEPDQEPVAV